MLEPALLHESIVDASEIDSLGHLNVRYYVERARKASYVLLEQSGITLREGEGIRWIDTFNRFHREQFEGARLQTYGGFINSDSFEGDSPALSRAYFEIRNPDSKTLAASFVMSMQIVDSAEQLVTDQDRLKVSHQPDRLVALPEHGTARTLKLKKLEVVSFEQIDSIVSVQTKPDMMTGRREATVLPEDCDATGWLREDLDLLHVLFREQPGQDMSSVGPSILQDEQGRRFSWAMLETRSYRVQRPAVNDTIIALGADLSVGEKWRYTRRWIFSKSTGLLLSINDSVGICIDLDARKSMLIPEELKNTITANCLPQFL